MSNFKSISIDDFIKVYLKNNPDSNKHKLKLLLNNALRDFKEGKKCACGQDIWVIGSAFMGNGCFTCLIGESTPDGDYEIEGALPKDSDVFIENKFSEEEDDKCDGCEGCGEDDVFDMFNTDDENSGYFDDDGNKLNPNLVPKPFLCMSCEIGDDPEEEVLCNLTRLGQKAGEEFKCFGYKRKS